MVAKRNQAIHAYELITLSNEKVFTLHEWFFDGCAEMTGISPSPEYHLKQQNSFHSLGWESLGISSPYKNMKSVKRDEQFQGIKVPISDPGGHPE